MKKGDRLNFKKFYWEIISVKETNYGQLEYKYKVVRKYFNGILKLSYSKCTYEVKKWRWNFLKKKLKKDQNYNYNMSLWSNEDR